MSAAPSPIHAAARGQPAGSSSPLLEVDNLVVHFPKRGGLLNRVVAKVHAVNGVSLAVREGETLGVVGESGCGKSTLAKAIARLTTPTSGRILFDGQDITRLRHGELLPIRRKLQFVFQDPYSALNPRYSAEAMLREVIRLHRIRAGRANIDAYVDELLAKVGLRPEARRRFPHEFSGGQRQRLNIARALAVRPRLLIADEPVSALDVSIQAQILNLLADLRDQYRLTMLFISHDLKVIEHFCSHVAVMYLGHIVEELPSELLSSAARHPYTQALLGANPPDDPANRRPLTVLSGELPSPYEPPAGCPFAGRCPIKKPRCVIDKPPLVNVGPGHAAACWEAAPPAA